MRTPKSKVPTSIRFEKSTNARLTTLSGRSGIPVTILIEAFVKLALDRVDEAGILSFQLAPSGAQQEAIDATVQAISDAAKATTGGKLIVEPRGSGSGASKGITTPSDKGSDPRENLRSAIASKRKRASKGNKESAA